MEAMTTPDYPWEDMHHRAYLLLQQMHDQFIVESNIILTYLQTQKFSPHLTLDDQWHIRHESPHYLLIGDDIYRQVVNIVLRHCLTHAEVEKVLNAFHDGTCGGHLSRMATT